MKTGSFYVASAIAVCFLVLFLLYNLFHTSSHTLYSVTPISTPSDNSAAGAIGNAPQTSLPPEPMMKRMLIRNANLSLQVNNIPQTMEKITLFSEESGGYIVNSNVVQDGENASASSADLSIRIPAQSLNPGLKQLKSFAEQTLQESVSGEDITQQYVDLESQLKNLLQSKKQLEKIMLGAANTEDVLKVQQHLSGTQGQIDVLEGQIKYYKESLVFSLITIHLVVNPMVQNKAQQQWKIMETFKGAYLNLISGLRSLTYNVIQFVVYLLPLLVLWGILCFVLYWIGVKLYNLFIK